MAYGDLPKPRGSDDILATLLERMYTDLETERRDHAITAASLRRAEIALAKAGPQLEALKAKLALAGHPVEDGNDG